MESEIVSMKKRNANLLETGLRSDCCFLVGVVPENQRLFQAHKLMLANASPVFERMFYERLPKEDGQPIEIYDIDADDFHDFLQFIYTEEISIISVDKAQQLYCVASKYMANQLMRECINFLRETLTPDNVCGIFEFAKQFEERNLEEACMDDIKSVTSDVLASSTFLLANVSTLDAILSQDKLNISCELELFKALERYAEFRFPIDKRSNPNCSICENQIPDTKFFVNKRESVIAESEITIDQDGDEITPTTTAKQMECSTKDGMNKVRNASRQLIEDMAYFCKLIKKIRFLTLDSKQFVKGPALSKLLSKADALDILICIDEPKYYKNHFPRGFCDLKTNRLWQEQSSGEEEENFEEQPYEQYQNLHIALNPSS